MTRIEGKTLTNEEREQLYEVERACFGDNWTREMLFEELDSPRSALTTRTQDGRIVGYALGKTVADEGELYRIGVIGEYRGRHIASELLEQLHALMKAAGAKKCFLEVRSKNAAAIALYEKSGYVRVSVRKRYYADDDALIYMREL